MTESDDHAKTGRRGTRFVTTRWSLVLRARRPDSPEARKALDELCRIYWKPLYVFARCRRHHHEDAEDLTQSFFASVIGTRYLEQADQAKGRFRSFLLAAFKYFLANDLDRQRAQKRGGDQIHVPLDEQLAASLWNSNELTPEEQYERQWALALLDAALKELEWENAEGERRRRFEVLKPFLTGDEPALSYAEVGTQLGISVNLVKVSVHNLRRDFRKCVRETVAETVDDPIDDPTQLEEEMQHLFDVLRRTRR